MKTQKQLTRKFKSEEYRCEFITANKQEAIQRKKIAKQVGFKATVIPLQKDMRTVYGVYIY